ncbi:hypothetical protein D3C77_329330 [compost metagenome]
MQCGLIGLNPDRNLTQLKQTRIPLLAQVTHGIEHLATDMRSDILLNIPSMVSNCARRQAARINDR